ncbi:MAG: ribosome biogenesis GTPase [Candidatus Azotimanducaceae bacterium]|jgi:ribosome biogenesis GTPase
MKTARVIEEHKTNYIISDGEKELTATVRGSFFTDESFPKVGDRVQFTTLADNKAVIEEILPRTSKIVRKDVGTGSAQVIAANVDVIFIVMGLDNDFNVSRLERYLLLAKQSGIEPIIVLNKSDNVDDVASYVQQVKAISGNTPAYAVSALNNQNMEALLSHLTPNITAVLLGSSGAGKSTITNRLLSEDAQKVSGVREDDSRGRHTTTSRQLFILPSGACLIDTPGMRELSVLDSSNKDENVIFSKIDELSTQCEFGNCDHEKSKGCAVLEAITTGDILERQLKNYQKLQRERLIKESKRDEQSSREHKQKQKKLYKSYDEAHTKKRFGNRF